MQEYRDAVSMIPTLIQQTTLELLNAGGQTIRLVISAVMARAGQERAAAIFVDNAAREIYGQRYFSGPNLNQSISEFVAAVMRAVQSAYDSEAQSASRQGHQYPPAHATMMRIRGTIAQMTGP